MKKTISGIRGIFGEDLNLRDILEFCNNFSSLIKSQKCVIGRDTRPSGVMISNTASAALMKNGINVLNLQTAPTPVIFREARKYGAGLVITASHNPVNWNGLKFIINGRGINEIELPQIIEHQEIIKSDIGSEKNISTSYIEDAKKIIGDIDSHPEIAIDVGGGAARGFASELLEKIGCKVEIINDKMINCTRGPDPTTDNLTELSKISEKKKKIGFAFDLDGDRLVIVNDGKKQTPDITLGLGIAKSLELGYKKFVLSTDTSISIEKFIKENGGTSQRSKVGEANVIELMLKNKSQAGGEGSSGGFILPEFNYCRDGILTSGLIASMVNNPMFDRVINYMSDYHQIREKITVDSKFHDEIIDKIESKFSKEYSETDTLDGIKGVIDENSWVLIRRSNTENAIRISAESNDKERCQKIINDALKQVKQEYDDDQIR